MLLTVIGFLVIAAFVVTIAAAAAPNKCPLWVAVLLICVVEMLRILPSGK